MGKDLHQVVSSIPDGIHPACMSLCTTGKNSPSNVKGFCVASLFPRDLTDSRFWSKRVVRLDLFLEILYCSSVDVKQCFHDICTIQWIDITHRSEIQITGG